jgi:glycosyltransferase involved in cell wall biosynthesis
MTDPIYVVLGVHRGGTSVVSRALGALGVDLGDNLMPGVPGNNDTGFWEDLDVVALDEQILNALDERWGGLRIFDRSMMDAGVYRDLVARACRLLESKMKGGAPFGFKDPRFSRLMFLWTEVFEKVGVEPRYAIALRDPLSVAKSLEKRNNFMPEQSYALWLTHMAGALHWTAGQRRVVIDYDHLLADPARELGRLGKALDMKSPDPTEVAEFASAFLARGLQHHKFDAAAVKADRRVPPLLVQLYETFRKLAVDELRPDDKLVADNAAAVWTKLNDLAPVFSFAEFSAVRADNLDLQLQIELGEYGKVVANRDEHIDQLARTVAGQNRRIIDLESVATRVYDLEERLDEATKRLARVGRNFYLTKIRLQNIKDSSFWRATALLRYGWELVETRILRRNFRFDLRSNNDVDILDEGFDWSSTGLDPNFVMTPVGGVYPSGPVLIKTELHGLSESRAAKLYYDPGGGVSEDTSVTIRVEPNGKIREIATLPGKIGYMRWDPLDAPGKFTQNAIVITRAGPIARMFHRFIRVFNAIKWQDRERLEAAGISWKNFIRHPQRTYEAAGRLRTKILDRSYQGWLRLNQLSAADRKAITEHIQSLDTRPLISILMPVYNAPAATLRKAIESVRAQLYPNFELCIADDASTEPHVKQVLEEAQRADSRIKVVYRDRNGHISAASNSALELASGEFVALLDHDDVLSEQALYRLVVELDKHPATDVFYSDEDKIFSEDAQAAEDKHGEPHFKSEWNPDLLYSQNYVSHLGVYRTALVREVGGFRQGFEGSQDYDLLLRCFAARKDIQVRHIPAILYHWRAAGTSTALSSDEKDYATENGIKALRDHFESLGRPGIVVEQGRFPTTYRVRHPIPNPPPKVSLIIPTRNHHQILRVCIDSIRDNTTYPHYEIVVVDNQSDDPDSLRYFEAIEKTGVRVLKYNEPFNYAAINNFAVDQVDGELIGLLNNDIEVISPDWLTELVSHALRPEIGAVGAKLYYSNDTIQHGGVILGLGGVAGHSHKHLPRDTPGYFRRLFLTQNLSAVTGACLVVRKDSYLKVNGMDSEKLTVAFNDVDLCLKLDESGLRNLWTPYAELYHHESASRGPEDSPQKIQRFQKEIAYMKARWGERLSRDPYYNRMLTLDRENFQPDYRYAPLKPWVADQ